MALSSRGKRRKSKAALGHAMEKLCCTAQWPSTPVISKGIDLFAKNGYRRAQRGTQSEGYALEEVLGSGIDKLGGERLWQRRAFTCPANDQLGYVMELLGIVCLAKELHR